jgi:uncharacterized membrane protein SpoIIM required for sporulation
VIIDLKRFIEHERTYWKELEGTLDRLQNNPDHRMELEALKRFHYLYQRASADLAKLATFSAEPGTHRYLESLVARAYAEIHETRKRPHRLSPLRWFFGTLPNTFRRHIGAFWLAMAVMLAGSAFGAGAVLVDPVAKDVLMPFPHLQLHPSERVAEEESEARDPYKGRKMSGSAMYFTHNTRVSITTFAMGMTWGIGTIVLLFYNGIILGAVVIDFIRAGETVFLTAWLAPHGVIEIPAIVLAGQAGLILGGALIGWGDRRTLRERLRTVAPDLVTLVFGIALMLSWAGVVEANISQYHEPVLPYAFKLGFAAVEFVLLIMFLTLAGRKAAREAARG